MGQSQPRLSTAAIILVMLLGVWLAPSAARAQATQPAMTNIALHRPYTLNPKPNYEYCTDPDDIVQLTDGQYTKGHFWTEKSTVGWVSSAPIFIEIDLGSVQAIRGVSFNTAAGIAGVKWPQAIYMLVSDDGKTYHDTGDLVRASAAHGPPPADGYAVHKLWTDQLKTRGRFVQLVVFLSGTCVFCDEIEVYAGDPAWLKLDPPGLTVTNVKEYLYLAKIQSRLGKDLDVVRGEIAGVALPGPGAGAGDAAATRSAFNKKADQIAQGIPLPPAMDLDHFRAVLPLNSLHAQIYALHGALAQAARTPPLCAWAANPWDPLDAMQVPAPDGSQTGAGGSPLFAGLAHNTAAVNIAAMRGEVRAGAFNLTNATDKPMVLSLRIAPAADDPDGIAPGDLSVHEVAWTDTHELVPVASALPLAERHGNAFLIHVPAGMTRQVWLSARIQKSKPGIHKGTITLTSDAGPTEGMGIPNVEVISVQVPLTLQVFDLSFPKQSTLHLGGWDYTESDPFYGVTATNRSKLIQHLREHGVDSPWGSPKILTFGDYDAAGHMTQPPDTTKFDAWVKNWPGAACYSVLANVKDKCGTVAVTDPGFNQAVGQWVRFWVDHAKDKGIKASQLFVLLVDEPRGTQEQEKFIVPWARAIRGVQDRFNIWEDPNFADPRKGAPEMYEVCDVLCPNRAQWLAGGKTFEDFFYRQHADGRRLNFYSCSGPAHALDPYSYYRLQAWACFANGAEGEHFWAFGDTGGSSSWNEYAAQLNNDCPVFLDDDSVTAAKPMEAIREGVEDFEYLVMLRDRVAEVKRKGSPAAGIDDAEKLLREAADQVLSAPQASELEWRKPKDRTIADKVRIQVATMLERLK